MPTVEDHQRFVSAILNIPPEQAAAMFFTSTPSKKKEEDKPKPRKLTDEDLKTYRDVVISLLG